MWRKQLIAQKIAAGTWTERLKTNNVFASLCLFLAFCLDFLRYPLGYSKRKIKEKRNKKGTGRNQQLLHNQNNTEAATHGNSVEYIEVANNLRIFTVDRGHGDIVLDHRQSDLIQDKLVQEAGRSPLGSSNPLNFL